MESKKLTIIGINVGGEIFQAKTVTLLGSLSEDSYLKKRVVDFLEGKDDYVIDGCLFIDRDPQTFEYVLNFLRGYEISLHPLNDVMFRMLKQDADFYNIKSLVECLQNHEEELQIPEEYRDLSKSEMIEEQQTALQAIVTILKERELLEENLPSCFHPDDTNSRLATWNRLNELKIRLALIQQEDTVDELTRSAGSFAVTSLLILIVTFEKITGKKISLDVDEKWRDWFTASKKKNLKNSILKKIAEKENVKENWSWAYGTLTEFFIPTILLAWTNAL